MSLPAPKKGANELAQPVFNHQEDDGDMSIFASGNLIVFSCENGHYWVLESPQKTAATVKATIEEIASPQEAEMLYRAM